ncbi:hypothetical protein Tco_0709427 [Tanacetum coccineum]
MMDNASGATSMHVPSVGQASTSPAEGEKNTKDAGTNLKDELNNLLGKYVVTQYYTKKLLFDKYCDKILKRKKIPKIKNYDNGEKYYKLVQTKVKKDGKPFMICPLASVAEYPLASALKVLRRLGSIFTLVYAAVQKLKKDSWLELQFSLTDNSKLNEEEVVPVKVEEQVVEPKVKKIEDDVIDLPKKALCKVRGEIDVELRDKTNATYAIEGLT